MLGSLGQVEVLPNKVWQPSTFLSSVPGRVRRYRVNSDADSWQGYLAERQRFLQAIEGANNAVVYSGDSHNFW